VSAGVGEGEGRWGGFHDKHHKLIHRPAVSVAVFVWQCGISYHLTGADHLLEQRREALVGRWIPQQPTDPVLDLRRRAMSNIFVFHIASTNRGILMIWFFVILCEL
jgi:hypothetical protein